MRKKRFRHRTRAGGALTHGRGSWGGGREWKKVSMRRTEIHVLLAPSHTLNTQLAKPHYASDAAS